MKSVGLNSASFAAFQTAFCRQTLHWCLWCASYLCLILPGQFHDSLLPVCVFALSVQAHLGIKVNMSHSSTAAVRSLWMMTDTASPPTQTGPLVRFWLLCGHVHQRREGGQAGRGEDGRCRPWCIVGPGAVCIHRYKNLPIYFLNRPQGNSASSSWEMVLVPTNYSPPPFSWRSRTSGVEGGHHWVSAVSLLLAPAVVCGSGLLLLPDEAAPPLQLSGHPLLRWRPGLPRPAEGCSRLHHGEFTLGVAVVRNESNSCWDQCCILKWKTGDSSANHAETVKTPPSTCTLSFDHFPSVTGG